MKGRIAVVCWLLLTPILAMADYTSHPQAQSFVEDMVSKHGFERSYVQRLMMDAQRKQSILDAISRPAERTKKWHEYRDIFVTSKRTEQGLEFLQTYRQTLARAEKAYGVPREIIAAIIGVETRYGRHKGSYRVLDALSTLAFDYPKRSKFFRKQLEHYLLMAKEQGFEVPSLKGSYAGAMGFGQFIPSSYRSYAVDFDGDGVVDIINNPVDAIGSVANYFKRHGWKAGEPITSIAAVATTNDATLANKSLKPTLAVAEWQKKGFSPKGGASDTELAALFELQGNNGPEFWLGYKNFYVITRYNHSRMYAMAVYQLSEALKSSL